MLTTLPRTWAAQYSDVDLFGQIRCVAREANEDFNCQCVTPGIATLSDLSKAAKLSSWIFLGDCS